MPKKIDKLMNLLKKESKREALDYFNEHKKTLFNKMNTALRGEELLNAFYELHSSFIKNEVSLTAYQNAINFYYDNCLLLKKIDIRSINFIKFQQITLFNEEIENKFHTTLSEEIEKSLQHRQTQDSIRTMLDHIRFAEALIERSIAKLDKKPKYSIIKSRLVSRLDETTSLSTALITSVLSNDTPSAQALQSKNPDNSVSSSKPSPAPRDATTPTMRKQPCIKSSGLMLPLKKRPVPGNDSIETASKRKALQEDDVPKAAQSIYRVT